MIAPFVGGPLAGQRIEVGPNPQATIVAEELTDWDVVITADPVALADGWSRQVTYHRHRYVGRSESAPEFAYFTGGVRPEHVVAVVLRGSSWATALQKYRGCGADPPYQIRGGLFLTRPRDACAAARRVQDEIVRRAMAWVELRETYWRVREEFERETDTPGSGA